MFMKPYVGKRIKAERLKYDLSLNELAGATGLSPSYLSLLENGKTAPSLKVLDKICTFFSIHISTLFSEEDELEDVFLFPKEKHIEVDSPGDRSLRFLLPRGALALEPVFVTLLPGNKKHEPTTHQGTEFGYVIRGSVEFCIEGYEPMVCREGDSIVYNSSIRHVLHNLEDVPSEALLIGFPGVNFRENLRDIQGKAIPQASAYLKGEER